MDPIYVDNATIMGIVIGVCATASLADVFASKSELDLMVEESR